MATHAKLHLVVLRRSYPPTPQNRTEQQILSLYFGHSPSLESQAEVMLQVIIERLLPRENIST
jgi:hypothetical protein